MGKAGLSRAWKGTAVAIPYSLLPVSRLFRRQGFQRQRVDRTTHHFTQRGVDQPVPRQRQLAGKLAGDHDRLEMHTIGTADLGPGTGQAAFDHCLDAGWVHRKCSIDVGRA